MKKTQLVTLAFATLMAWAAQASQEKLAASISATRSETIGTREQLQSTVNALKALTSQKKGDLRQSYNDYVAAVRDTQAAAARTGTRAETMGKTSKEYFEDWQASVNSIANRSLQKKSQKRLDAARKSYDKVVVSLTEAAEKFKPLLSDLDDVQRALANDVTPAGVKSVRGAASDADWNVKKVRRSINSALEEMDEMGKSLSSQSKG
jgi:hypothetical protein